jgi:hypothetical protein
MAIPRIKVENKAISANRETDSLIRELIWLQLLSGSKGDCYEEKGKHYEIYENG